MKSSALQEAINSFLISKKNAVIEAAKTAGQKAGVAGIVTAKQQNEVDNYYKALEVRKLLESGGFPSRPQINEGYVYDGLLNNKKNIKSTQNLLPTKNMAEPYFNPKRAALEDFGHKLKVRNIPIQEVSRQGGVEKVAPLIFKQYGIPMSVGWGMYAAEGRGKGLGAERNNFYNIAAFDSNPNAAFHYKTPAEGVEAYAKFITGKSDRYASPDHKLKFQEAYKLRNNPQVYIKAIEQAGYAGDPKTYGQRANNGFKSYSDFVMATPEWKKYAMSNLSLDN